MLRKYPHGKGIGYYIKIPQTRKLRFAGLNIRSLNLIEVFTEISWPEVLKYCLVKLKRGAYIQGRTLAVLLKTMKA